jgi:hypothetical protein
VRETPGANRGLNFWFDFWCWAATVFNIQSIDRREAAAGLGLASCFVLEDFSVVAEVELELEFLLAVAR